MLDFEMNKLYFFILFCFYIGIALEQD